MYILLAFRLINILLTFVNIFFQTGKLFFYGFYMSINIYLLNKIGGKKHESECSELWSNKQTNVASRAKTGMK